MSQIDGDNNTDSIRTGAPTPAPTPRTVEQVAQECAEYQLGFGTTKVECLTVDEAASIIAATMREVVKCELAAKDREIARLKEIEAQFTGAIMQCQCPNSVYERARAEKAEAELAKQRSGEGSDGYHTFNELYEHRHALFLMLMRSHPSLSWISRKHHDGSEWSGWFIAGIKTPCGDITYHLPSVYWDYAATTGAAVLEAGMVWDGHTPAQVVDRLREWIAIGTSISAERDQLRAEVERLNAENDELLKERDEAEDAADNIASEVLGESIDWPFHDAAWRRAAEAAKEMRFELHMRRNSPAMDEVIKLRAELAAAREAKHGTP